MEKQSWRFKVDQEMFEEVLQEFEKMQEALTTGREALTQDEFLDYVAAKFIKTHEFLKSMPQELIQREVLDRLTPEAQEQFSENMVSGPRIFKKFLEKYKE